MVRHTKNIRELGHTSKTLQQMLQDFKGVYDQVVWRFYDIEK